jgi:hypothetical protein
MFLIVKTGEEELFKCDKNFGRGNVYPSSLLTRGRNSRKGCLGVSHFYHYQTLSHLVHHCHIVTASAKPYARDKHKPVSSL